MKHFVADFAIFHTGGAGPQTGHGAFSYARAGSRRRALAEGRQHVALMVVSMLLRRLFEKKSTELAPGRTFGFIRAEWRWGQVFMPGLESGAG